MSKGGIFNVGNVLGAVEDEFDEYSEAPGVDITSPTFSEVTPDSINLDVLKPKAAPVAAPVSSGFWAGLTDTQRILVGLAAAAGVYFLWKGMTKKTRRASYAANKRRHVRHNPKHKARKGKGKRRSKSFYQRIGRKGGKATARKRHGKKGRRR